MALCQRRPVPYLVSQRINNCHNRFRRQWETLLDENILAQGHEYFRLGALTVSPDGKKLAYSVDTNGSERYQLHTIDLATRRGLDTKY